MAHPTALPLARAAQHLAAHRFPEAAGAFRAVLSIDPNEHRAYLGLADCAYARGEVDQAVEELVGAAQDYAERDLHEGAFTLLTKALAFAPHRLELHIDIAELEAAAGQVELAKTRLRNLAQAYRHAGGFEEAEAVLEVVAGWEAVETVGQAAAPQPLPVDSTLPNLVGTDATVPEDGVDLDDFDDLEIDGVMELMDEADPAEKAPALASGGSGSQATVQTVIAPAPSSPPIQVGQTLAPRNPARRAKGKREVKRWRPSSVTGAQDAVPSAVVQDRTVAMGGRPVVGSAARAARPIVTPAPRPTKPSAPIAAPDKSIPAPGKSARRSSIIAPAPSPKRGGHKLDKLPPREGAPAKPVAKLRIPAPPPAGTPKPVPLQTTTRYGRSRGSDAKAVVPPRTPTKTKASAKAASAQSVPPPPPTGTRLRASSTGSSPAKAGSTGSLADRLRKHSKLERRLDVRAPAGRMQQSEEEDPTRLWCPDHLLLEQTRTSV